MFLPHRLHALHELHRLGRLSHLHDVGHFADHIPRHAWTPPRARRARRSPGLGSILLAGLVAFGLYKLLSSASSRQRSTGEKLAIGGLIALLGVVLLSIRRAYARRQWV